MIPAGECGKCGLEHKRCHAHVHRDDEGTRPCGAYPIRGGTVCPVHGGMAPQVQAKAADELLRRAAEREAALSRPRRRPHEILLDAMHLADVQAQEAEEDGRSDAQLLREKATGLARTVLDRDLEQLAVRFTDEQAAQIAHVLDGVLSRVGLTALQRTQVPGSLTAEVAATEFTTWSLRLSAERLVRDLEAQMEEALARVVVDAWLDAVQELRQSHPGEVDTAQVRFIRAVRDRLNEASAGPAGVELAASWVPR